MFKKILLCASATLVCSNAFADNWVFRGTPNAWQTTPMKAPVAPSTLFTTCQNFVSGDANGGPRFKIDNATKGSWVESYPSTDRVVDANSSYDITFDPASHVVNQTKRTSACPTASSSSSAVSSSSKSSTSSVVSSSSKPSSSSVASSSSKPSSSSVASSSSKSSSSSVVSSSSSSKSSVASSTSSSSAIPVHLRGTQTTPTWIEGDLMTPTGTNTYEICRNFTVGDANGGPRFKIDPNGGWGTDAFPASDVATTGWTKIVVNISTKTFTKTSNMAANCAASSSSSSVTSSSVASSSAIPVHFRGTQTTPTWIEGDLMTPTGPNTYEICRNFTVGDANGGPRFKIDPNGAWGTDAFPASDVAASGWTKVVANISTKTFTQTSNMAANCGATSSSSRSSSSSSSSSSSIAINVDRSLLVHDQATLNVSDANGPLFNLKRVLTQLATQLNAKNPGRPTTAAELFARMWDSQNDPANQVFSDGAKCTGTLNGFPAECRPAEGNQARNPETEMAKYIPIALVNRFDLHDANFTNCGEYRIIFGRNDGQRNFIIFEAQVGNPVSTDRQMCLPIVNFWKNLSAENSATTRGQLLANFYYNGLPNNGNFAPIGAVFNVDNYAAGTGQIRANMFMGSSWLLKEFKVAVEGGLSQIKPVSVKANPFGQLFNDSTRTDALAVQFRQQFLNNMSSLLIQDLSTFSLTVENDAHNNGQSHAQAFTFPDENDYPNHATTSFKNAIQTRAAQLGSPLTADQVLNRAKAMTCGGCHQLSSFADVGFGKSWPLSAGFVHVSEFISGDGTFPLSPALTDVFLPSRKAGMETFLNSFNVPAGGSVAPASTTPTPLIGKRSG